MNKLNFSNTGGFPFDTNILAFMQDAYDLLNALGELAGDLTILKGCTVTGSTVSDGVVYINGEVLAFKGGTGTQVIIKEDVTELPFEDGFSKEVEKVRYATFGIASISYAWADFVRAGRAIVPRGLISMWSGAVASLPRGWVLCDGENGTPDLRGRFIVGAGEDYDVGATGGENKHTLSEDEMPSHTHRVTGGSHAHGYRDRYFVERPSDGALPANGGVEYTGKDVYGSNDSDSDNTYFYYKNATTSYEGGHEHTVANTGGNYAHENRPPYYALAYIIFKG